MNRPRKHDRHLPRGVYFRHGAYYHVVAGKWHPLGRDLANALHEYGRRVSAPAGSMPRLIDEAMPGILRGKASATQAQYKAAAAVLRRKLAEFNPDQVTQRHVVAIRESMAETPNMANRVLSVLRQVFDYALIQQRIDGNPAAAVKRLPEAKRKRFVTDAEFQAIRAQAAPWLQVLMDLQYLTGQRVGDVLAIRHADVSNAGIAFQQRKTDARLVVQRTQALAAVLERAKGLQGNVRGMTVLCGRGGRPIAYKTAYDAFRSAAERAKITDVSINDLRAKSLTAARREGKDATALAGHSSVAMTERYIRQRDVPVVEGPAWTEKDATKKA